MALKIPYIARELSWLSFNERVLQEAADPQVPLLERMKFLGIFSSNLDEFFRVRVATLTRLVDLGDAKEAIIPDPSNTLKQIQKITLEQHQRFNSVYQGILDELARRRIYIIDEKGLSAEQGEWVKFFFQTQVRSRLFPVMLDQVDKFPELRDAYITLAVCLYRGDDESKVKYALIEVPTDRISRFVILPQVRRTQYIMLLDDVIRYALGDIFSRFHFNRFTAHTIKLTRDAGLDIDDDISQSYIKKISKSVKQRKEGSPVRFIYDSEIPETLLKLFIRQFHLDSQDTLIPGARYHNFKDFMKFPQFDFAHSRYEPVQALPHQAIDRETSFFEIMDRQDFILHYPYHSFDYVIDLLREASIDPHVSSIRITVYRVAAHSSVLNALINAVKNGKSVTVVLELQARFDEEANIYWANKLQEEGVRVIFGVTGLKVHSKLCLITRRGKGKNKRSLKKYALIGTGNFNEATALTYSDHTLFTSDRRLTTEVQAIFDFFESPYKVPAFKHLLVSPFDFRQKITRMIKNEIANAREGKEAYIFWKLNNLVDSRIITRLYEASKAGVKIKLIVRSMFSLIPGVPGFSDNIEAVSIVDQYLEHTRIYVFCNNGAERIFISSADLMPRNLDGRVEVTCPVYDESIQRELKGFLDIQWKDNVKARVYEQNSVNRVKRGNAKIKVRAQQEIYRYLKSLHGGTKTAVRSEQ